MQFRRWDSVGSVELKSPPTEAPDPALWIHLARRFPYPVTAKGLSETA
jgi:hypothetical protein